MGGKHNGIQKSGEEPIFLQKIQRQASGRRKIGSFPGSRKTGTDSEKPAGTAFIYSSGQRDACQD